MGNLDGFYGGEEENLNRLWARYQNMSEEQMSAEIMSTLQSARASGTLTNESLNAFYQNIAPYLTGEQQANLRHIISRLAGY